MPSPSMGLSTMTGILFTPVSWVVLTFNAPDLLLLVVGEDSDVVVEAVSTHKEGMEDSDSASDGSGGREELRFRVEGVRSPS
jgi:hypothetical protein